MDLVTMYAKFVVLAIGGLCLPSYPSYPGLELFKGPAFHSAEWDHSIDLKVRIYPTNAMAMVQI